MTTEQEQWVLFKNNGFSNAQIVRLSSINGLLPSEIAKLLQQAEADQSKCYEVSAYPKVVQALKRVVERAEEHNRPDYGAYMDDDDVEAACAALAAVHPEASNAK